VDDRQGKRLWAATVAHDEAGATRWFQAPVTLVGEHVAVKAREGLLIERPLEAGLTVIAMLSARSRRPD
jgi:hypothetical protein